MTVSPEAGPGDPMIRLSGVSKTYPDGTVAVGHLDLDVPRGELVCFVGPSGCGKTTTLRMINRLIEPTGGTILLDGEDVTRTDPVKLRRRMGYVIQNVGLFPHQRIWQNVATVCRLEGWPKDKAKARAYELLELVGLEPSTYADRFPAQLSGGQRQRVGVARALAADPPVLLMDEPFSAIDPIARDRLQGEFLRIQAEVRKTVVMVTHDIDEAVRLGDRVAVFRQGGHLEQYDTPATILGSPASDFVADFVGADRGLRRLAVTPVGQDDLEHPTVVTLRQSAPDAAAVLLREGARWAVVLDDDGNLHGWVDSRTLVSGSGTVADHARRMEAWIPLGGSLKQAMAEMLTHDAGWVAVLDGGRYLGVLTPATLHSALRHSVTDDAGTEQEPSVATLS